MDIKNLRRTNKSANRSSYTATGGIAYNSLAHDDAEDCYDQSSE